MNRANRPPSSGIPSDGTIWAWGVVEECRHWATLPHRARTAFNAHPYRDGCGHATPIRPSPRTSKLLRLSWAYLTTIPKHGSSPAPLAALAFYVKRCRARYGQFCAVLLLPHTCPDCQIIRPPGLHYSAGGGLRP